MVVRSLRFDRPDMTGMLDPGVDWVAVLDFLDREHLTLAAGARWETRVPEAVAQRIRNNVVANSLRHERIRDTYLEIAERFERSGIEHVVLKGFSHWPCYVADPRLRPQYDIDLLCQPAALAGAREALAGLRYEPLFDTSGVPVDHLPPMIRKTGWLWKGDYFDPELPPAVELHFRFWDEGTERIGATGAEHFWERRTTRALRDFRFPALDRIDTLAYASMHLLRHILRGDFRIYHAYELACFLHETSACDDFWRRWRALQPEPLRTLQGISFEFASRWFGCSLAPQAASAVQSLPEPVMAWFDQFSQAPLASKERPNKSEIWLHLALVRSRADRALILRRRLLPKTNPTCYAPHVPQSATTFRLRVERQMFQARFVTKRMAHHARAIGPTLRDGLRFGIRKYEIDPRLGRFLGATALFNFGLGIFFLLYNVFLTGRGYHEDLLGTVASAMSLGSIAGTLPGAFVLRKFGAGRVLRAAFLIAPLMCALRVLAPAPAVMIPTAFLGGAVFAFYAVSIPPIVAAFTTERSRRTGFSIVFASGIGIGVLAGFAGGQLPALLAKIPAFSNAPVALTLLIACSISLLGAIPIARLDLGATQKPSASRDVYPSDPGVLKFLAALLIWNLALGAFNPFFSVYFTKELGMGIGALGTMFSAGQAVQVAALLIAPLVLRRFGTISGLSLMQGSTALALASLASGVSGWIAGAIYATYVASQYMTEPAIYSLLMERVTPEERGGASALNFLIVFGAQALSAAAAGFAVRRWGYRIVLAVAGLMALSAALSMRRLLASRGNSLSSTVAIS